MTSSIPPAVRSWKGGLGAIVTLLAIAGGIRACYSESAAASKAVVAAHDDSGSSHRDLRDRVQANESQARGNSSRLDVLERRYIVLEREILDELKRLKNDER